MTIKVTKDRVKEAERALKALGAKRVLVGVPEGNDARQPEPGEKPSPLGNAALAYIHNNGAPEANIPARPFMEPGIAVARPRIEELLIDAGKHLFDLPMWVTLNQIGLIAETEIKKKIESGPFTPLKPATIAARRRKGIKSVKPLIRTGELLGSINYVIADA